jgi:membrane-associated phospholipid phosphatase
MTTLRARSLASLLTIVIVLAGRLPAHAQTIPSSLTPDDKQGGSTPSTTTPARPSLLRPFADTLGDIRHLPTRDNLNWLAVGLGAALVTHRADTGITRNWSQPGSGTFKPGAIIGGTPLELGAAFATYAIGRAANSPRATSLGGDLVRAQLLAELMTTGMKQTLRRTRPEGSGFSFPSGHTTVTFASATVLQRHFGWKVGVPAYAVASYVAASRVEMRRHYLSDVAFGAALGILAGRTVSMGRGHRLMLTPMMTPRGGGAAFTWIGKPNGRLP